VFDGWLSLSVVWTGGGQEEKPVLVPLNSSVLKPSTQYMELGYTMKFLCSFSGNAECLHVTGAVLSTACRRQKGVESTAAGSDEIKKRSELFSQCCRKKSSNCCVQCMWYFRIVWYLPIDSVKKTGRDVVVSDNLSVALAILLKQLHWSSCCKFLPHNRYEG